MARRCKAEGTLIVLALILGVPIYVVGKVLEVTGWLWPLAGLIAVIATVVGVRIMKHRQRLATLRSKYSEPDVQRILARTVWQSQTEDQLIDTLVHPVAVDRKVLKTIRREVWKYGRTSAQRYPSRPGKLRDE